MDRRACADLPALALQLLSRSHPDWKALPVAVVDADEPNGTLLWLNDKAWRARLRPGMRYASALALDGRLRAGTVSKTEIDEAIAGVTTILRMHTPNVEPSREEAGVFWLDANGLDSLYTSLEAWARTVARGIRGAGFDAHLVAGFTRFGTYALARTLRSRVLVCQSEQEERRLVRDVALDRLGIDPKLRDALSRLGVHTVGSFLDLPAEGIRRRFGSDALLLHRRARGEAWDPLVPLPPEETPVRTLLLEDPVGDTAILLLVVRRLLAELLDPLAAREKAIAALTVKLHRSLRRDSPALVLHVRAAEPTLDEAVLLDLVRLRLENQLRRELAGSSIVEVEVEAETAEAGREQLRLFQQRTRRDLAAGARAIARLKAEFGDGCVVHAVLRQGHLPEAGYAWEEIDKPALPSPRVVLLKPLVRRIEERALALPPKPFRERDDCWISSPASGERRDVRAGRQGRNEGDDDSVHDSMDTCYARVHDSADVRYARVHANTDARYARVHDNTDARYEAGNSNGPVDHRTRRPLLVHGKTRTPTPRGNAHGRVENMTGADIVSGGWWNREVHREYHYASTENGEILWVYYDRHRRRWFLAGKVE